MGCQQGNLYIKYWSRRIAVSGLADADLLQAPSQPLEDFLVFYLPSRNPAQFRRPAYIADANKVETTRISSDGILHIECELLIEIDGTRGTTTEKTAHDQYRANCHSPNHNSSAWPSRRIALYIAVRRHGAAACRFDGNTLFLSVVSLHGLVQILDNEQRHLFCRLIERFTHSGSTVFSECFN